jgi:hypothetical protein
MGRIDVDGIVTFDGIVIYEIEGVVLELRFYEEMPDMSVQLPLFNCVRSIASIQLRQFALSGTALDLAEGVRSVDLP